MQEGVPRKPYTIAYDPPAYALDPRPGVIFWFRAYAAVMLLASLVTLAFATFLGWGQTLPEVAVLPVATETQTQVMVLFLLSATCVALFGTATFMPFKAWAWTFGLIVIGLGIPGITVIVCLPLLLAWRRPNVRAAFCRL